MSDRSNKPTPSIFGMITSPIQQFKRIKEKPVIWVAMLVVIVITIIGESFVIKGMEISNLDIELGNTFLVLIGSAIITSIIEVLLGILIISAIHMLIAKIALTSVSFRQLFSMNTYIWIISALGVLLNGIVAVIVGVDEPNMIFTNLGSIVHSSGVIEGLLQHIEVFSIWGYILTGLGLHIVANFSKKTAWIIVSAFFVINIIFSIVGSYFSQMVGV